jgi:hypothetical protein
VRKPFPIDLSVLLMGLGLILFIWAKWSDLSLPFFWDELGVYAPGVLHLVDNGVGILPADMPPGLAMPNVFAQAHLVLPEVLLALLVIWALYHYYQHRYWAYVIWASLAVLTKEVVSICWV